MLHLLLLYVDSMFLCCFMDEKCLIWMLIVLLCLVCVQSDTGSRMYSINFLVYSYVNIVTCIIQHLSFGLVFSKVFELPTSKGRAALNLECKPFRAHQHEGYGVFKTLQYRVVGYYSLKNEAIENSEFRVVWHCQHTTLYLWILLKHECVVSDFFSERKHFIVSCLFFLILKM